MEDLPILTDKDGNDVGLKIVIVGDGGVGKTVLLWAYMHNEFRDEHVPTVLDMYSLKMQIMGKLLKLEIFDTAGQEDFSAIRQACLQGVDSCIVCYSCTSVDSLENIKMLWVPEITSLGSEPKYIFVGTKSDLWNKNDPFMVTSKMAKRLGLALNAESVLRCSALLFGNSRTHKGNVNKVFKEAIRAGLLKREIIEKKKRWCPML